MASNLLTKLPSSLANHSHLVDLQLLNNRLTVINQSTFAVLSNLETL
jgi:Leucine-rich repeat (LRR) protein